MFKPDSNTATAPRMVPQEEVDTGQDMPAGTPLGAFTGYLRRPKPSGQGMTALIFGENGPDADIISALHLTRFQEALVKVSVWTLKDKDGRVQRGEDGNPPLLTEFIGRVKRPSPSMAGQVAQFFGENGPNSDAINVMNQTRSLDSLVYVEITKADPGQTPADIVVNTPQEALEAQNSRLTPTELKALKKQQNSAAEALKVLKLAQFFQSEAVWSVLGSEKDFYDWTAHQSCCHPGLAPCHEGPVEPFKIPGGRRYQVVPLCRDHRALWERGEASAGAQNPLDFLKTRHISLVQRWADERLREALKVPAGYDPTPAAIYDWAIQNRVTSLLPRQFHAFL